MGALVPIGTAALSSSLKNLANTAMQKFASLIGGKSPEQRAAEYAMSDITNDIERAMDINRWAFWSGLISQDAALQNYAYLWNVLETIAARYSQISPAQAHRLIADRDYGGQFAFEWRGFFRDSISGAAPEQMQNGYVVPAWQWDWGPEKLKYGDAPSDIQTPVPLPTPGQIGQFHAATSSPTSPFAWLTWAGLGWLAWKLFLKG